MFILQTHLKSIDIFVDCSFSYKIDQDACTLKIWIIGTFQGDSLIAKSKKAEITEIGYEKTRRTFKKEVR